jgi:hypothetical protein
MPLQERDFFHETTEVKPARYTCAHCRHRDEYQVRWLHRTKKDRVPPGADDRDRAMYAKLRDYLVRLDEVVVCKKCQRRFEIPSHQSVVLL